MDEHPDAEGVAPAPDSPAPVPLFPGPDPFSAEPVSFTGTGGEYFKIWIVNLALTIVTLGVYSAWAKVRRLQYFYRHTRLAGAGFDYHGDPIAILKGRIIARGTVDELRGMAGSPDDQLTPVFLKLTGGSGLQELDEIV